MKLSRATQRKLNEFRRVFEKWEKENVAEDDQIKMSDDDLIHLALTCGIDYYGGNRNV